MLEHLEDLASDFSAFHRVDDIMEMDPVRFFSLARRLSAYEGVMRLRVEEQSSKKNNRGGSSEAPKKVAPETLSVMDDSLIEFG